MSEEIEAATVLNAETMLMGWGESDTQGPWIKLRLNTTAELDAFRGMTKAKGDKAGQRLATCCVQIGDDEKPQPLAGKPKGGALSQLAAQWCREERFRRWMRTAFAGYNGIIWGNTPVDGCTEGDAAVVLRAVSGINSRAELDTDPEAKARFERLIRQPYRTWLAQQ